MVEVSIPTYSMLILHFRSMEILGISLPLQSCDLVDPSLAQTILLHALFLSLIMDLYESWKELMFLSPTFHNFGSFLRGLIGIII